MRAPGVCRFGNVLPGGSIDISHGRRPRCEVGIRAGGTVSVPCELRRYGADGDVGDIFRGFGVAARDLWRRCAVESAPALARLGVVWSGGRRRRVAAP